MLTKIRRGVWNECLFGIIKLKKRARGGGDMTCGSKTRDLIGRPWPFWLDWESVELKIMGEVKLLTAMRCLFTVVVSVSFWVLGSGAKDWWWCVCMRVWQREGERERDQEMVRNLWLEMREQWGDLLGLNYGSNKNRWWAISCNLSKKRKKKGRKMKKNLTHNLMSSNPVPSFFFPFSLPFTTHSWYKHPSHIPANTIPHLYPVLSASRMIRYSSCLKIVLVWLCSL